MTTFKCERCGHTDRALASEMYHPCKIRKPRDGRKRLVRMSPIHLDTATRSVQAYEPPCGSDERSDYELVAS